MIRLGNGRSNGLADPPRTGAKLTAGAALRKPAVDRWRGNGARAGAGYLAVLLVLPASKTGCGTLDRPYPEGRSGRCRNRSVSASVAFDGYQDGAADTGEEQDRGPGGEDWREQPGLAERQDDAIDDQK